MPRNLGKITLEEIEKVFEILNKNKRDNFFSPALIKTFGKLESFRLTQIFPKSFCSIIGEQKIRAIVDKKES